LRNEDWRTERSNNAYSQVGMATGRGGHCDEKKILFIYLLQYTYKNLEAIIYTLIYHYI